MGKVSTGRGPEAAGIASMVNGTITVNTPVIRTDSVVSLTPVSNGTGTDGVLRVSAINAGQNFTISSASANDTASVAWVIFQNGL